MAGIKKVIVLHDSRSGKPVGYIKGVLSSKKFINITFTKDLAKKYVSDARIQDEIDKVARITNNRYICTIDEL